MYAIIETGGKQYRVSPNDEIQIEKLNLNQGDYFNLDSVLAVSDDNGNFNIGQPYLEGATVNAQVIEQGKDDKIIIYKYKPKKKYRRKQGHRQPFTRIRINDISFRPQDEAAPEEEVEQEEVVVDTEPQQTENTVQEEIVEETLSE